MDILSATCIYVSRHDVWNALRSEVSVCVRVFVGALISLTDLEVTRCASCFSETRAYPLMLFFT